MPDVRCAYLTPAIAQKLVEICPTAAFQIEEHEGRARLRLSYGECIGCTRCFEPSEGAVIPAQSLSVCGQPKTRLIRVWEAGNGR